MDGVGVKPCPALNFKTPPSYKGVTSQGATCTKSTKKESLQEAVMVRGT